MYQVVDLQHSDVEGVLFSLNLAEDTSDFSHRMKACDSVLFLMADACVLWATASSSPKCVVDEVRCEYIGNVS